jgi:hypothetical protein
MNPDIFFKSIKHLDYHNVFKLCSTNKQYKELCKKYNQSLIKKLHKNLNNIKYINTKLALSKSEDEINRCIYWGAKIDNDKYNPLIIAIQYNNLFFIDYIKFEFNIDLKKEIIWNNNEYFLLDIAIYYSQLDVTEYLLVFEEKLRPITFINVFRSDNIQIFKILMEHLIENEIGNREDEDNEEGLLNLEDIFHIAIRETNNLKIFDILIGDYQVSVFSNDHYALRYIIDNENIKLFDNIIPNYENGDGNINFDNGYCLEKSRELNNLQMFKKIIKIPEINIHIGNNYIIKNIIENDQILFFKEVINAHNYNIKINDESLFKIATENNSLNIVEYTCNMGYEDSTELESILKQSIVNENYELTKLLLIYSNLVNQYYYDELVEIGFEFKNMSVKMMKLLLEYRYKFDLDEDILKSENKKLYELLKNHKINEEIIFSIH